MLEVEDFREFFEEVHGYEPFPWQERLLRQVVEEGSWPTVLDLPTGAGKTAAIDVGLFHLALEAERGSERQAPVRIAIVVDRRLVVDDAYAHACKLEQALCDPTGPRTAAVAQRLRQLALGGPPMLARRLRGGIPREDDWARTPSQPTVLCSTVDQVGSRLLFRGYGVSDSMKPVHAGLLGSDCLILLDEAHLSTPFRQTLNWVNFYRGHKWRQESEYGPWGVSLLTATPGEDEERFLLDEDDLRHPVLRKRLEAEKPARLLTKALSRKGGAEAEETQRAQVLVDEVKATIEQLTKADNGVQVPAVGVVVNRVARARRVHELLCETWAAQIKDEEIPDPLLMIGPARATDRDSIASRLEPIRTRLWKEGERRVLDRPLILVATQCVEVGVDVDLDAIITEAAPLDCLRQRFGRLNRAGRVVAAQGTVIAWKPELSTKYEDPIYGTTVSMTWDRLMAEAEQSDKGPWVNFRIEGWKIPTDNDVLAPKQDAPVLMPAHVDLLSATSPIPACDPEVGIFLHGPKRQPDSISVVWRGDIDPVSQRSNMTRRLLTMVPPRSTEAVGLPIWVVRRWLLAIEATDYTLGDVAGGAPDEGQEEGFEDKRPVFRWRGDEDESHWIGHRDLRPGDTVVVPASYGGLDRYGWKPDHKEVVEDIGQQAGDAYAARRYAVRVAPGLVGDLRAGRLAEAIAAATSRRWHDVRAAIQSLPLPETLDEALERLDTARGGKVICYPEPYGTDSQGRPRGVVFVAPLGIEAAATVISESSSTEDDVTGSMPGYSVPLHVHNTEVGEQTRVFAQACGLSDQRIADLELAGKLHDAGKADHRFQAWLYHGDPLGPDETRPEAVLAKSGRRLPRDAREASGLPARWRHEAASVRRARMGNALREARDADLVLWLIGVHHGYGRPLYPHHDPEEDGANEGSPGPQSLAFDLRGLDWATLFKQMKKRYGIWELARMEAILRLADHNVSGARSANGGGR